MKAAMHETFSDSPLGVPKCVGELFLGELHQLLVEVMKNRLQYSPD